jgi:hypothetical protein
VNGQVVSQPDELPEALERLLLGPIDSFEKLEIAIALRASNISRWTLDQVAERTGAPTSVLARALEELAAAGIVELGGDAWSLASGCDVGAIDELVTAWSSRRAAVLAVMTQRSLERIRASAASTFADAFTFRRRGNTDRGGDDG